MDSTRIQLALDVGVINIFKGMKLNRFDLALNLALVRHKFYHLSKS